MTVARPIIGHRWARTDQRVSLEFVERHERLHSYWLNQVHSDGSSKQHLLSLYGCFPILVPQRLLLRVFLGVDKGQLEYWMKKLSNYISFFHIINWLTVHLSNVLVSLTLKELEQLSGSRNQISKQTSSDSSELLSWIWQGL